VRENRIRLICAACQKVLVEGPADGSDARVSHGLCEGCYYHFAARYGIPVEEYIESIKVPTVVVSPDGVVSGANKLAYDMLGKIPWQVQGYRCGDVFECVHAREPGGCGHTIHCSGCTIRRTVMHTAETGQAQIDVPAIINDKERHNNGPKRLLISTKMKNGVVFLSIQPAIAA
jgi:hypothetical protein